MWRPEVATLQAAPAKEVPMLNGRFPRSGWFGSAFGLALAAAGAAFPAGDCFAASAQPVYFDVSRGAGPHDVAAVPAAGGAVFYTAQATGKIGVLDPASGKTEEIALGPR